MKKILGLAIAAILVMASVGLGTWTYFADIESSSNNQITAGTLDLKFNNGDADYTILTGLTDKAPGDTGSNYAPLKNAGTLPGKLSIQTGTVTNTGATVGTNEFADGVGHLGADAELAPWIDMGGDGGSFVAGVDVALKNDGTTTQTGLQWGTWNSFASQTWTVINSMDHDQTVNFYLDWRISTSVDNEIQGDGVKITITFNLEQIHA